MDVLESVGLAVDAGLCVLIWIVQLVIYPGFAFYPSDGFQKWHTKYTVRITTIVFPLMMLQLVLGGIELWSGMSWLNLVSFVLVISTWMSTFFQFVPLHSRLDNGEDIRDTISVMVRKNWIRTFLWSAIFVLALVQMLTGIS
jgi:hypothetical protein